MTSSPEPVVPSRQLGASGLMVSAVGIGCNAFSRRVDQDGVVAVLDAAQDCGVTLLDTADVYGAEPGASEELLGRALRGRRDEFVVATEFDRIEALTRYAEQRDLALLDVAIAGLAAQPAVASVISGVTSADQLRRNAAAMAWQPTPADLEELAAL